MFLRNYFASHLETKQTKTDIKMEDYNKNDRQEIFSKKIRAGKRTYFFDVKATKGNDYFITITESKKKFDDGSFVKHKIFLYKEDFNKFIEALTDTVNHVKTDLMPDYDYDETARNDHFHDDNREETYS